MPSRPHEATGIEYNTNSHQDFVICGSLNNVYILSTSTDLRTIELFDVQNGQQISSLVPNEAHFYCSDFVVS